MSVDTVVVMDCELAIQKCLFEFRRAAVVLPLFETQVARGTQIEFLPILNRDGQVGQILQSPLTKLPQTFFNRFGTNFPNSFASDVTRRGQIDQRQIFAVFKHDF